MGSFEPGLSVYVTYADDLFHERIILAWVHGAEYVIVTPDFDV